MLEVRRFGVGELQTYHRNPRRGDVKAIAESLRVRGQYRPIVVNLGTRTGRPLEVLAGNHTLLAARALGWESIEATTVDVDDDGAAQIVVADNRLADLGEYDEAELARLLADLDSLEGTGFSDQDVASMMAALVPPRARQGAVDPSSKVEETAGEGSSASAGATASPVRARAAVASPAPKRAAWRPDRVVILMDVLSGRSRGCADASETRREDCIVPDPRGGPPRTPGPLPRSFAQGPQVRGGRDVKGDGSFALRRGRDAESGEGTPPTPRPGAGPAAPGASSSQGDEEFSSSTEMEACARVLAGHLVLAGHAVHFDAPQFIGAP